MKQPQGCEAEVEKLEQSTNGELLKITSDNLEQAFEQAVLCLSAGTHEAFMADSNRPSAMQAAFGDDSESQATRMVKQQDPYSDPSEVLGKPKKSMLTTQNTMQVNAEGFIKTASQIGAGSVLEQPKIIREINEDEEAKTAANAENDEEENRDKVQQM